LLFSARVHVTLKSAVNDPQGSVVLGSLHSLGFGSVNDVRVGKFLTLELDAKDQPTAERQVAEMCDKLLANPVIESYSAEVSASS
jgi:phosphoribosylformylglycinamidine synthase PurS subunit